MNVSQQSTRPVGYALDRGALADLYAAQERYHVSHEPLPVVPQRRSHWCFFALLTVVALLHAVPLLF